MFDREAVANPRQTHQRSAAGLSNESIDNLQRADRVVFALQHDPGMLQVQCGCKYECAMIITRKRELRGRADSGAAKCLMRTETQADGACKCAHRGLCKGGIDECRAGGIA